MTSSDLRHHLDSALMRESLLDKDVEASTETPVVRMLPDVKVVKIGGRSIIDGGKKTLCPVIEVLANALDTHKLVIGTGGGVRTRHVFSVGLDLGLPTGVLAQLAVADALANAHVVGTLLAPYGVVAIPPEIFGHLLPLFIRVAPGVIFNGVPPYSIWEHPPTIGRIPPHRTDAGSTLLADCFGVERCILIKDVDGVYEEDPRKNPASRFLPDVTTSQLRELAPDTLPFDRVVLDILDTSRLLREIQIVNGLEPDRILAALSGEHVGTIVRAG